MSEPSISRAPTKAERIGGALGASFLAAVSLLVLVGFAVAIYRTQAPSVDFFIGATLSLLSFVWFFRAAYRGFFLGSSLPSNRTVKVVSIVMIALGAAGAIGPLFYGTPEPRVIGFSLCFLGYGMWNLKQSRVQSGAGG